VSTKGSNDLEIVSLFSTQTVKSGSKAYPISYSMPNGGPSTGVNEPWSETDQSLPSSIEVKQERFHTATPSRFRSYTRKVVPLLYIVRFSLYPNWRNWHYIITNNQIMAGKVTLLSKLSSVRCKLNFQNLVLECFGCRKSWRGRKVEYTLKLQPHTA